MERGGERLHSILRRGTDHRRVGGPFVSLILRMSQFERDVLKDCNFFMIVAGFMQETRTASRAAKALGVCLSSQASNTPALKPSTKVLGQLLYRIDPSDRHRCLNKQRASHKRASEIAFKDAKTAHTKSQPPLKKQRLPNLALMDKLLSKAFLPHFRAVHAQSQSVFSLPKSCFGTARDQPAIADMDDVLGHHGKQLTVDDDLHFDGSVSQLDASDPQGAAARHDALLPMRP